MHRFDYSEILGDIPSDIVSLMVEITRVRGEERIRRSNYKSDYKRMAQTGFAGGAQRSSVEASLYPVVQFALEHD